MCPSATLCTAAKAERLRQAKAEAEKEISAYRAEREGAYQKKLAEVGGVLVRSQCGLSSEGSSSAIF